MNGFLAFLMWFALWGGGLLLNAAFANQIIPINTLSRSLRTVCATGGTAWYERIKALAHQHPCLEFALLHDHPLVPAQPPSHYYWARNQRLSCGSLFIWFDPSMDEWRRREAWMELGKGLESGQHLVVGAPQSDPDYPRIVRWLYEFRKEEPKVRLDDMWLSVAYLDGEFGIRREFPITDECR